MRENRSSGSEGGVARAIPTPILDRLPALRRSQSFVLEARPAIRASTGAGDVAVEADDELELAGA